MKGTKQMKRTNFFIGITIICVLTTIVIVEHFSDKKKLRSVC